MWQHLQAVLDVELYSPIVKKPFQSKQLLKNESVTLHLLSSVKS